MFVFYPRMTIRKYVLKPLPALMTTMMVKLAPSLYGSPDMCFAAKSKPEMNTAPTVLEELLVEQAKTHLAAKLH